jgi:M6 family metalloprotease-like protein
MNAFLVVVLSPSLLAPSGGGGRVHSSTAVVVHAMTSNPLPFREIQPNGLAITLRLEGDEDDAYLVDHDGYTVLKDETTGEYKYAQLSQEGDLECSPISVGDDTVVIIEEEEEDHIDMDDNDGHPQRYQPYQGEKDEMVMMNPPGNGDNSNSNSTKFDEEKKIVRLKKATRPTKPRNCTADKWCGDDDNYNDGDGNSDSGFRRLLLRQQSQQLDRSNKKRRRRSLRGSGQDSYLGSSGLSEGAVLRNLVIPLRWSDHTERALPTVDQLNVLMNHDGPHVLCPTGSIRDFFSENSYGKLTLESHVVDWVPMNQTESYYANGERGLSRHFHSAILDALNYLEDNQLVDFNYFDRDNDSMIDAITFLHSGYAAEFGGTDVFGGSYTDRIWSHKWSIRPRFNSRRSGVIVGDYHIASALWGTSGSEIARIGVIAHETGHYLGLPDLYDRDGGGNGIGSYGAMGNAWGFDGSQKYPPHLSAWSKIQLGWLEAAEPTQGQNLIEATEIQNPTLPQVYKITKNFPDGEYILIENRQRIGFDSAMPQGGLVIWHIDEKAGLNQEGHPFQPSWPQNGNHYRVAVLPADGQYQLERMRNRGDGQDVFHAQGVNQLTSCRTHPSCQYPNTNSYQYGNIIATDISISKISNSGTIMSFHHSSPIKTDAPTTKPSSAPTDSPTFPPLFVEIDVSKSENSSDGDYNDEISGQGQKSFTLHANVAGGVQPYVGFAWSFGDGTITFGKEDTRQHAFEVGRSYTLRVVAIDSDGNTDQAHYLLTV